MDKSGVKKGKRALVFFRTGKEISEKNVPVARARIVAEEYRKKTGKPVTIRLS